MAGKPQKNLAYSVLLDFYGPALTEKQRAILTEYYDEDLSLAEIAENFGITRQGVRDAIKHGEAAWMSWKRSWVTPAATHRCRKTSPGCTSWSWRSGAAIRGCSTRYRASARIPTKC